MKSKTDVSTLFKAMIIMVFPVLLAVSCAGSRSAAGTSAASGTEKQSVAQESHTSVNSLDWQGVYKGVIPCADCEGIEVRIALKKDGSFTRSTRYIGKDDNVFADEGVFVWNETGSKITLQGDGGGQQYLVGENQLFHLDREGNRITGELADSCRLVKNRTDQKLEDRKWVLTELMGKAFEPDEGRHEGYLVFSMETGRFSGNNSCNNYFGQYELLEGNRIRFGKAGSTLMACPDMETQKVFMEVLQMADNYTVADGVLSLNKARMAPLARFRLAENQQE